MYGKMKKKAKKMMKTHAGLKGLLEFQRSKVNHGKPPAEKVTKK